MKKQPLIHMNTCDIENFSSNIDMDQFGPDDPGIFLGAGDIIWSVIMQHLEPTLGQINKLIKDTDIIRTDPNQGEYTDLRDIYECDSVLQIITEWMKDIYSLRSTCKRFRNIYSQIRIQFIIIEREKFTVNKCWSIPRPSIVLNDIDTLSNPWYNTGRLRFQKYYWSLLSTAPMSTETNTRIRSLVIIPNGHISGISKENKRFLKEIKQVRLGRRKKLSYKAN